MENLNSSLRLSFLIFYHHIFHESLILNNQEELHKMLFQLLKMNYVQSCIQPLFQFVDKIHKAHGRLVMIWEGSYRSRRILYIFAPCLVLSPSRRTPSGRAYCGGGRNFIQVRAKILDAGDIVACLAAGDFGEFFVPIASHKRSGEFNRYDVL